MRDQQRNGEEFSGIDTAPEDPRHVQQVIDHIAHLEDEQVAEIRDAMNSWGPTVEGSAEEVVCTCPASVRETGRHSVGCLTRKPLEATERETLSSQRRIGRS